MTQSTGDTGRRQDKTEVQQEERSNKTETKHAKYQQKKKEEKTESAESLGKQDDHLCPWPNLE